jgi:hypothetical protein
MLHLNGIFLSPIYMRSPTELGSVPNIRSVTQRKFIVFGEGDTSGFSFFSTP